MKEKRNHYYVTMSASKFNWISVGSMPRIIFYAHSR